MSGGLGKLHGKTGVEHVRRRHALVDEARIGADMLGQVGEEGDDVVLGLGLDLVDPRHLEGAPVAHRLGRLLWNHAQLGQGVASVGLDLQPDAELVLGLPDGGHFGAAVTWDHRGLIDGVGAGGKR